jgi:hypothetical protein
LNEKQKLSLKNSQLNTYVEKSGYIKETSHEISSLLMPPLHPKVKKVKKIPPSMVLEDIDASPILRT